MDEMQRIEKISELSNLLVDVNNLLEELHDTRELSIIRTDMQKVLAFYTLYVMTQELNFTLVAESNDGVDMLEDN